MSHDFVRGQSVAETCFSDPFNPMEKEKKNSFYTNVTHIILLYAHHIVM